MNSIAPHECLISARRRTILDAAQLRSSAENFANYADNKEILNITILSEDNHNILLSCE
jgi:hypothetical protein